MESPRMQLGKQRRFYADPDSDSDSDPDADCDPKSVNGFHKHA